MLKKRDTVEVAECNHVGQITHIFGFFNISNFIEIVHEDNLIIACSYQSVHSKLQNHRRCMYVCMYR